MVKEINCMKKVLCLLVIVSVIFIVSGCGESASNTKVEETEQVVTTAINDNDIRYADMIPSNDIFKNGEFTIIDSDGGSTYAFSVTGFTDEEFKEYVAQCKELGFDDVTYDLDSRFGAYSTDGKYWVQLSKESDGSLSIICQKSKNK